MFLMARLKSNVVTPSWGRRAVGIGWMAVIVSLLAVVPVIAWLAVVFGVGVGGYQLSSLLQFTGEHRCLAEAPPGVRRSVALSHGRFCSEAPPAKGGLWPWTRWTVRMLSWQRANYVRSELIASGKDKGMVGTGVVSSDPRLHWLTAFNRTCRRRPPDPIGPGAR